MIYPQGVKGSCRHLDVLCGITSQDRCTKETPVSIHLHLQRYPSKHQEDENPRLVNVLVLENYTSKHYHNRIEAMIDKMKFQQINGNSNKYMRIATELPRACITFGNRTLRIHEATRDLQDAERDALKMSKFLQCVEDLVLSNFIEILTQTLLDGDNSKCDQDDYNPATKKGHCSLLETPEPTTAFHYPVGEQESYDAPNSVVSHISKSDPYAPHSDSRPTKPFNHDNNLVCHHEDSMRIPTHCHVFSSDQSLIPEEVITIRHGLRDSSNKDTFCKQVGCFSSKKNKFTAANREDIPVGGAVTCITRWLGHRVSCSII